MKIKNKVLVLGLAVAVLSGCATATKKTTIKRPNGDVVVVEEVTTSKNESVINALRLATIVLVAHKYDDVNGALLGSVAEIYKQKKLLEMKRDEKLLNNKEKRFNRIKKLLDGEDI